MIEIEYHGVDVVERSIEALLSEVVRLTLEGYTISSTNKGDAVGWNSYTVSMYRDKASVQTFKKANDTVEGPPKLSRAEILTKARAAKGTKSVVLDMNNIIESN